MSRSSSSMATVLVVLMVVSAGGLSPPCAAAAKEEKPVVVLPPAAAPGEAPSADAAAFADRDGSSFCYYHLLPYAAFFEGNQVKVAEVAATILSTNLWVYVDQLRKADRDGSSFCYDHLLPYAAFFEGNQVKVAEVAATILSTNLWVYVDQLRKGGAGKGDPNLNACVDDFSVAAGENITREALQSLGRLAAAGNGKRSKEDLENAQKWIKGVEKPYNGGIGKASGCEIGYLFTYSDDLPAQKTLGYTFDTASSLINHIKL
uniref:Pectinesterase inhibitor domain-containing protein n=1 Tax=Oryza rufipogon TaxID=4529 RepID=A0A0E0QFQ9_ORYRU